MVRERKISSIVGGGSREQPSRRSLDIRPRKRKKVHCYCNKCNGKLVLKQTKLLHNLENVNDLNENDSSSENRSTQDTAPEIIGIEPLQIDDVIRIDDENQASTSALQGYFENRNQQITEDMNTEVDTDAKHFFLPHTRVRRTRRANCLTFELADRGSESAVDNMSEFASERNTESSLEDSEANNESYSEIFEDYSPPPYEDIEIEEIPNDDQFLWILLWIMSFRIRFNLPETATESLLKFMKLVLDEIGGDNFKSFPTSLYLAKKALGLKDQFQSFVPCAKCHKLYNKQEVIDFRQDGTLTVKKCDHVEFPNSSRRRMRPCNTPLSRQIDVSTVQPELIFPFAGIRQQLTTMYRRQGFESHLRHWSNRQQFNNILTDIYDGQVWQTLKESSDEGSPNFFRPEVSDSHLGIILNLDWFQPYDGTNHSTGVIYAAICNLPRDIRFKRENLLLIGLLPGPNEVSLHKINHYLAPIVDELQSLWNGLTLDRTFEHPEGRKIHAALILVSCDIPAARKICGHVSALVSCHRCHKHANYEDNQHNFAGMQNMDEWFVSRSSTEHRENALGWRRCNSDASRKRFVKQTGVRWTELLQLPYFDPVRFTTIDPMHCLFLGIAKWIVKRIWVDEGVLTQHNLRKVQKTMSRFQVPADLG